MLVRCDLYQRGGKWKYGGEVEIEKLPWEKGVLAAFIKNQNIVTANTFRYNEFTLVMSDLPESENDPNYRMTYNRLYQPSEVTYKALAIEGE